MKPLVYLMSLLLLRGVALAQTFTPMSPGEQRVEVKLSPSLQPVADVPGLPRVLLIGDSISMGYTLRVRKLLDGRANLHRAPANCGPTIKGLAEIDAWLGQEHWDVIHFNFGLHDLKYLKPGVQQVPPAAYEANLRKLVARLKATAAVLVWANTTPVPAEVKKGEYPRIPADIGRYNDIAAQVMADNGIAIDDLYSVINPHRAELQNPMDVHFNSKGYDLLARQVAASILRVLPASPSTSK